MQDADSQNQAHHETTNMCKVVQTGEQTEHKGDSDVEEEEQQVRDGGTARVPVVEEVEKDEGEDAE